MAKFTINDVELEFDIYELENAEKYEAQIEKMRKVGEMAAKETGLARSIKLQCEAIFDFIDTLFGEGSAKKLFGERTNLVNCANVYYKVISEIAKDRSALPNVHSREQRRKSK